MSNYALLSTQRRMGITGDEMTGHGFRATTRTIRSEALGFRHDLLEHQQAHSVRSPLGRAYDRTSFLDERRDMMQVWVNYLDTIKAKATSEFLA